MRRDLSLLENAEEGGGGCRVYGWDGAWVSVGRFQSADSDLVDPSRVRWVRRPTGGKAVLHGHDVTVGLAISLERLPSCDGRTIRSAYRAVIQPLIGAMQSCRLNAVLAADSPYSGRGRLSGDCFAFSSPNDVVDAQTGRKLCGCALRMTQRAVLLQASIPNGPPLVAPESVILNAQWVQPSSLDENEFAQALKAELSVFW